MPATRPAELDSSRHGRTTPEPTRRRQGRRSLPSPMRLVHFAVLGLATAAFVPAGMAGQHLTQTKVTGVRQPAGPRDGPLAELRRGVAGRARTALADELRHRWADGRRHRHAVERDGGVRLRLLQVPRELFEAARVDGCSFFGLFWRSALPLCRPALIIVFVFELQASWSDLLKPLIYLQTEEYFTMPRGLKQIVDSFALSGEYHWGIAMAATLIATVPMIIVFAFAQRYIIDGIATSAKQG